MNITSPKSSLVKLGLYPKPRSLKVMILGQTGVGKSALVVRFISKRYIGDYDPTLEKIYTFHTMIDKNLVYFEILDTAGQPNEAACSGLEANIRWAEAFILMYSVTDKCSFDECHRLKFLINYNKKRRRLGNVGRESCCDVPVVLVGNKTDQIEDRMVSPEEGQRRSKEIGCVCFHEISVRESVEQVLDVFSDVCRFWRLHGKNPLRLRKTGSEKQGLSPESIQIFCSVAVSGSLPNTRSTEVLGMPCTEDDLEEEDESENKESNSSSPLEAQPFRERASTDGLIQHKPWRWRYPVPSTSNSLLEFTSNAKRRMSISMKGNNSSY